MKIEHYLQDGANRQAKAVLAFITPCIEESWNDKHARYDANINVARWEN